LFSPAALIEDDGDVVERYEYDAYGKPYFFEPNLALADTQESDYNNVILFTGRCVDFLDDDDLKLQYSRNRYYRLFSPLDKSCHFTYSVRGRLSC